MKKSWKYGIIAGGVAAIIVGALVLSGYNRGRMPTLPTPPGVTVPAGMRYVGGDEFDGPDGSAPVIFKRSKQLKDISLPECKVLTGALYLAPTWSGSSNRSYAGVDYPTKLSLRHPLRIEIRAKVHVPERTRLFAKANKTGGIQDIVSATLVGEKFRPMHPGTYLSIFEFAYSRDGVGVYERTGRQNFITLDEQFHTYSMEWRHGEVTWTRDSMPIKEGWNFGRPVIPYGWYDHLTFLPERVQSFLQNWKSVPDDTNASFSMGYGDLIRPEDSNDLASMEVDYVRVFQRD